MPFTDWSTGDLITATKLDNDNTVSVGTDTARTVTVTHTWSASQTFNGGFTGGASADITINTNKFTVTASTGATTIASTITSTKSSGSLFENTAASTSEKYLRVSSTGGDVYLGVEASTGGTFFTGSANYATVLYSPNNTVNVMYPGGGVVTMNSSGLGISVGGLLTEAPTGGAGRWKLGIANAVSPTSPNRTLTVDIGGTLYYIHAKTTND
jgi:hypothetical protein